MRQAIINIASQENPEGAVACDEMWVRELYRSTGLHIKRLDYGSWCERDRYLSYQVVVQFEILDQYLSAL
jgi:hypothetical protein